MNFSYNMRIIHRYLGFFLAGIMSIYAISGMLLIFRETEFLKYETKVERNFEKDIAIDALGKAMRVIDIKLLKEENNICFFKQGTFDRNTGIANFTTKQYPYLLEKMTKLHKANTKQPLFILNLLFGLSLLIYVVSAFWMFVPGTDIFKKGMYFALAGFIMSLFLLLI